MQIAVDAERCVGAGSCALTAAEVFDQDDADGTVVLLDDSPPSRLAGEVADAAVMCPSGAITVRRAR